MNPARLYCKSGCAACAGLTRYLDEGGVAVEVYDVTTEPDAFGEVAALGYRSLPVLVGPNGSSAAGAEATRFAQRLVEVTTSESRDVLPLGVAERWRS